MTSVSEAKIGILSDSEALSHRVADWIIELATAKEGVFGIALSGGSTPRPVYEHLAASSYRDSFPWFRTHVFWGDERLVPHADALSNYRLAREALLSRIPIPAANIHPIRTQVVTGTDKQEILDRFLRRDDALSAPRLHPTGKLFVFADAAAR